MSLGRAWKHALFTKLGEASKAGFKGIEIFYEDLDYLASTYGDTNRENLLKAATDVRSWCTDFKLEVVCLQPFMFYEGLVDRAEHAKRIEKIKLWFELVKILETDMILVPSNFSSDPESITGDIDLVVQDMLELANLGLQQTPPVRFAYENLAWGTHIDKWEQVYAIVQKVNKPNFGMCIDSFNICARIYADPTQPEGKIPTADEDFNASMTRLATTVDVKKIFFVQIVDGEKMKEPLVEGHPWYQADQPARMSWSRNARLFAYEKGGCLPVEKVLDVLFKELKFEGWVSMELFSRTMAEKDESVPQSHAARGIASWREMVGRFALSG